MKKKKQRLRKEVVVALKVIVLLIIAFIGIKYVINYATVNKEDKIINSNIITIKAHNKTRKRNSNDSMKIITNTRFDKYDLLQADITSLRVINKDTYGWINFYNTDISLPFVKGEDNEYYKNHSYLDDKYNLGWIYADKDNKINSMDKHIVLHMNDSFYKRMFSEINKVWLNNEKNTVIKLSIKEENTLWEIISYYKGDFDQRIDLKDDFLSYGNGLINKSEYKFNSYLNENDKLLTITTGKVNIHAKLIKVDKR